MKSTMFAACLLLLAGPMAKAQSPAAEEKEPKFQKIHLLPTDTRSIFLASVQVEGEFVGFVIDSGAATPLVFAESLAAKLKKPVTAGGHAGGVGGAVRTGTAEFNEIVIARQMKVPGGKFRVMDISNVKARIKGQDEAASGLIGAPFLSGIRAVFDYETSSLLIPDKAAPKLAFKNRSKAAGDHVFPLIPGETSFAFAKVRIKGNDYAFLVDTGSALNIMHPSLAEKLQLKAEETTAGAVGGGKDKSHKNLKRVEVEQPVVAEDLVLRSISFYLIDTGHLVDGPEGLVFGGIIGTDLLDFLKAKVDFGSYSLVLPKSVGEKR